MHRTTFLPLAWSLLLGFVLGAHAPLAWAQGPDPQLPGFGQLKEFGAPKDAKGLAKEAPEPYILIMSKDSTRQIEMSTKELIAEFRSENPKIVKVQALADNPRAILLTGVGPGTTRVYLTDVKKNSESLEVRVPQGDEEEREAKRRDLLEQIHKAVPTAGVDVLASANGTVVLSGNVPHGDSVQVIVELTRGVFGPATNVVNAMRIGGVQLVQIDVVIARVNRSKARNIGFSFLNAGQRHFLASTIGGAGALATQATLPSVLSPAVSLAATPNAVFGFFNDKQSFMGYLTALTTEGLAKLISEPKVVTLSGRPAWVVSGGETPILTTSGTGAPSVSYKTFGTIVNFLPIVLGNGKIHLEVRPEISSLNAAAGITIPSAVGTTSVPGFDLRSAQVTVQMEDGQTLAIGGLIQNTVNAQNSKVPILGDIPVLAFAFSSKTYLEAEEELIILVTPHLVDPMACCQLPKYLPGRETRRADDFELFLEGILEAPRGQREVGHPYTAAYLNGPSSAAYPCGDGARGHFGHRGGAACAPNGAGCAPGCAANGTGCPQPVGRSPAIGALYPSTPQANTADPGNRLPVQSTGETAVPPASPAQGSPAPGSSAQGRDLEPMAAPPGVIPPGSTPVPPILPAFAQPRVSD